MRKFTKREINKLRKYWKRLEKLQDDFDELVYILTGEMAQDLKIEDLEFFMSDGGYCGIGNMSRTIELIHEHQLRSKK